MRKHASVKVSKFIEEAQVSLSEGSKGKNETFPVVIEIASSTLKDSLSPKKDFHRNWPNLPQIRKRVFHRKMCKC